MRSEFERLYRNRFSFLMPDRALVAEAVSVEAVGRADAGPGLIVASPASIARPMPHARVTMTTHGAAHDTPVFMREKLAPGTRIAGPAIIEERETTIIILPGWRANVHATGCIMASRA